MTDTPSTILLLRLQSTGSNVNTWGGYLNTAMQMIEQASKGYQALAVTGDATITWTNYTTANTGECGFLKLTGTLTSAATLTFPNNQNLLPVKNTAGATVTIKCSGGTGVSIPNGRTALIACDGTDYVDVVPSWIGTATTLTNNGDLVSNLQLQTAIAAASGLTAPFILVDAADTTAGYLGTKVNVTGAGALTFTPSTTNPGGNEVKTFTGSVTYGAMLDGGAKAAPFTAAINTKYRVTAGQAITGPAAATVGDRLEFSFDGAVSTAFSPNGLKCNGLTSTFYLDGNQTVSMVYTTTNGWV